ncbi:choline TMA-lyase-activating enzyme, partial [Escherichia coli]
YHQFGRNKYQKLEMIYPIKNDPGYTPEELDRLEAFFKQFDFEIRLVRH